MNSSGHHKRTARGWLVDFPRAVPIIIFLLVASITALSVFAIERADDRRELASMRETARAVSSALERRSSTSSAYLRSGAALFATLGDVPEAQFRRFANELKLDNNYRGGDGIGWAEAITPAKLAEYQRTAGASLGSRPEIFPVPDASRNLIVPVTYLEPQNERNRRAIGFDMYSEPTRREAMIEAQRSVRPTASGRIVLRQEGNNETPGFLIYMPVFANGETTRALLGYIYSPFNAQQFLNSALQVESRDTLGIRLYDGAIAPERLMASVSPAVATGDTITASLQIANRPMILSVESARGNSLSELSMATLIFGLLVASLLMVVARLLTQQAIEDRASLEWLREQNSIRQTLTRELNHRVKNTLANVLSLIALTRRRADNLDEFAEGIDGRIRALSATHDLLTQSEWGTTPIAEVVKAELAPYTQGSGDVLSVDGPAVELAPSDALSLGLAIHELATNAAKYGALGEVGGKVSVHWTREDDAVRIVWQESGGPAVPQTRKRGFGIDLIEKIVAHELNNPVELDFAPEGVRCVITVPVRQPSDFAIRANR